MQQSECIDPRTTARMFHRALADHDLTWRLSTPVLFRECGLRPRQMVGDDLRIFRIFCPRENLERRMIRGDAVLQRLAIAVFAQGLERITDVGLDGRPVERIAITRFYLERGTVRDDAVLQRLRIASFAETPQR